MERMCPSSCERSSNRRVEKLTGCKLVSEAYCHSFMDGDGMRGLNGDPIDIAIL